MVAAPVEDGKRAIFDVLAPRWDEAKSQEAITAGVSRGLSLLGDLSGLEVVDIGCGPGRLEPFLLARIGTGRIVAVDFAVEMIARGAARCPDGRVTWLCRDVLRTGLADSSADVVLCFNAFPHFPGAGEVLREVARWLRPGGAFLLWHDVGRGRLAEIHRRAGREVEGDLLPPVEELVLLGSEAGLLVESAEEDDSSYTFLARRTG